ncbi:MAG: FtsX-like permease family protein [Roseivirga sp.]|nr:FtsX-like permease family protein [Roseivirga sp.]
MIKNYFKTGIRNLFRHKGYALINIGGLAIGIASCLLISMFVKDELTYDRQHESFDQIYRITTVSTRQEKRKEMQASCYPAAEAYARQIPEIKHFTRLRKEGAAVRASEELFDEKRMVFADDGLFRVFDFKLVEGAFDNDINNLSSVVLTERAAKKYLGATQWVGQTLNMNVGKGFEDFIVTAVIENHPSNSSFDFDVILPWTKFETIRNAQSLGLWFITPADSFIELQEGADLQTVIDKMRDVRWASNPGDEGVAAYAKQSHNELLPLSEVHWNSRSNSADIRQSYILSGIAVLILIIACFNFANLTIVNSTRRAKEVGVRKTIGARKKQLVSQFLAEAVIICVVAFLFGVVLAELALPVFERITEKNFTRNILDDQGLLLISFAGVLLASLLSVIYPSLILSRLRIVRVFKGHVQLGGKRFLTKFMVTFQFLLAMVFITVTVSLNRQHDFLVEKDKGYNDENLIRLSLPTTDSEALALRFKAALEANSGILSVGAANDLNEANWVENEQGEKVLMITGYATPDYLKTLGVKVLEGRGLTAADRLIEDPAIANVLVNERTMEILGPDYQVGSTMLDGQFRIVGVMADYQLFSAKIPDRALLLRANPRAGNNFFLNNVFIQYQSGNLPGILADLETTWKSLLPEEPFQYTFMDVYNENLYKKEALWSQTLNYASSLAIAVSIMGLLGLVGLTASQKKKEVSIRKVLGASVSRLVILLNQGFTRLLLLAILLSVPIAYYIIDLFLQDYINRMEITAWLFILPTVATFLVVWLTVSSITFRSARQNPVDTLRYE